MIGKIESIGARLLLRFVPKIEAAAVVTVCESNARWGIPNGICQCNGTGTRVFCYYGW